MPLRAISEQGKEFVENQKTYCTVKKVPLFIPFNGICFSCKKNIFDDEKTTKIAHTEHITGCPFCNYSFCE